METDLDRVDKQLLSEKLLKIFDKNKSTNKLDDFFTQIADIFNQFDINLRLVDIKNPANVPKMFIADSVDVTNVNDILLIQLTSMRDSVLSTAFIREIRNKYPDANIELICEELFSDLYKNCPYVNRIIKFNSLNCQGISDILKFLANNLWDIQYNLSINLNWDYNPNSTMLSVLSGSFNRVGYQSNVAGDLYYVNFNQNQEQLIRKKMTDLFAYTHILESPVDMFSDRERKLWILSKLDVSIKSNKLELWTDPEDLKYVEQFLKPNKRNIIINNTSKILNRCYPVNQLIEAIDGIDNENNHYIIVGLKYSYMNDNMFFQDEIAKLNSTNITTLCEKLQDKNISFSSAVGKTTLSQLIALISKSDLYLGINTSLVNMVEAYNKPMIVLCQEAKESEKQRTGYLSTYRRFKPISDKCYVLRPEKCLDNCGKYPIVGHCAAPYPHCITQISPKEIVNTYKEIVNA